MDLLTVGFGTLTLGPGYRCLLDWLLSGAQLTQGRGWVRVLLERLLRPKLQVRPKAEVGADKIALMRHKAEIRAYGSIQSDLL